MKTEESVSIKQINTNRIRDFMNLEGSVSKSRISRQLGLSFPTVTRLMDELCASGEVLEQGTGSSTGGRCACMYRLNPGYHLYLLIQIENGRVRWTLKDLEESLVEQGEFEFGTFSLERLDQLLTGTAARYEHLSAAAIGIAALVSRGVVEESDLFGYLKGIDITEHLRSVTPIPVVLENDMNFLTMGCWTVWKGSVNSLVTLFLNNCGMGGGMIIDGKLWTGASGFSTEPCFLPFMDKYWDGLAGDLSRYDIVEPYTRLIQIYSVTVNPSMVILYSHPLLEGKLDEIRRSCAASIPAKALPAIELSRNYQKDYESGLFAMARSASRDGPKRT